MVLRRARRPRFSFARVPENEIRAGRRLLASRPPDRPAV
jgi:hypothetical protein